MRQNSSEPVQNMITLEEYLKRRQAIKSKGSVYKEDYTDNKATVLKLAELLYV